MPGWAQGGRHPKGASIGQYKISIRNTRREFVDQIKNLEKNKEISQDELHRYQEQVQKTTDNHISEIDNITVQKEKEIMEI